PRAGRGEPRAAGAPGATRLPRPARPGGARGRDAVRPDPARCAVLGDRGDPAPPGHQVAAPRRGHPGLREAAGGDPAQLPCAPRPRWAAAVRHLLGARRRERRGGGSLRRGDPRRAPRGGPRTAVARTAGTHRRLPLCSADQGGPGMTRAHIIPAALLACFGVATSAFGNALDGVLAVRAAYVNV